LPAPLVFDSRLTTYAGLGRLDEMGVSFITLSRRSRKIRNEIRELAPSAWRRITLDVPNRKYCTPRVWEKKVTLAGHTGRDNVGKGHLAAVPDCERYISSIFIAKAPLLQDHARLARRDPVRT
jgi:hypothetical protein